MRFLENGPNIPDELLIAQEQGEVLFLCGAGVSMPAGLPSFLKLACLVAADRGMPKDDPLRSRIEDALSGKCDTPPLDGVFEQLREAYGDAAVEASVAKMLRLKPKATIATHETILALSRDQHGRGRVLTTNFDTSFERADKKLKRISAPLLPELRDEHPLDGVVYLHGRLSPKPDATAPRSPLVLSAADFGRAYLAEGWATRFMLDVLSRYVVVLVGYSADDPPINYLLQGLRSLKASTTRSIYAFAPETPGASALWRKRKVEAILYDPADQSHSGLWNSLRAWAERARDHDAWRRGIIELSQRGPRALRAHERGQVASVIKSVTGARAFAEATPAPPAEWLCVFDASLRYQKPDRVSYDAEEVFDPLAAYGLDDDPPRRTEKDHWRDSAPQGLDLLSPLPRDGTQQCRGRLGGAFAHAQQDLPPRLQALMHWIARNWSEPATLWWVGAKGAINPELTSRVRAHMSQSDIEAVVARKAWRLVGEIGAPDPHQFRWYEFAPRLKREGFTPSTLRQLADAIRPRLVVERAAWRGFAAILSAKPISSTSDLIDIDIDWFKRDAQTPHATGPDLISLTREVREALRHGASLLADIEPLFHSTPAVEAEGGPGERSVSDEGKFFLWYVDLFRQLAKEAPEAAYRETQAWPHSEPYFFDKLRLWSWMFAAVVPIEDVCNGLKALNDSSFWHAYNRRELLHTLKARWSEMGDEARNAIEARIISARTQRKTESDEDYLENIAADAASMLGWLEANGCALSNKSQSKLPQLIEASGKDWRQSWIDTADHSFDGRHGWVGSNTDCSSVEQLPIGEIIAACDTIAAREGAGTFTHDRPFDGLAAKRPLLALAALAAAARRQNYPLAYWQSLLQSWPKEAAPRASWLLAQRIVALPQKTRGELRTQAPRWLKENFERIDAYRGGSALYAWDAIFDALKDGGPQTESALLSGEEGRYDKAINSPIGEATDALLTILNAKKLKANAEMPEAFASRLQACLAVHGDAGQHAASIIGRSFRWLAYIAPTWAGSQILPRFDFGHAQAIATWDGYLADNQLPRPHWFQRLKPYFISAVERGELWQGRHGAQRLGEFLTFAAALTTPKRMLITTEEARAALQATTGEVRQAALGQLIEIVGEKNGWKKYGARFLTDVWPLEVRHQTNETTAAWLRIATESGDEFPKAARAIAQSGVLTPVQELDTFTWTMRGREKDSVPIAKAYPVEALALLDAVIATQREFPPYDLRAVLELMAEANPSIRQDSRWIRLRSIGHQDKAA